MHEIVTNLGSGMNDRKKSLRRLLDDIVEVRVGRLVSSHATAPFVPHTLRSRAPAGR
jgi:predicted site-specific integrase-resolvase